MTSNRIAFSDSEILFYGANQGFPLNPGLSFLQNDRTMGEKDGLVSATKKNPVLKLVADYVAAGFMNPKNALKVFACIEEYFLRFRTVLPYTKTADSSFALIYESGDNGGYLACENRDTIFEMLRELSGVNNIRETSPACMEISPIYLIIILAACDIILQNKYEGVVYSSIGFNAYDISGEKDFRRIIFPLVYVSDDILYRSVSYELIQKALDEMAKEEILEVDEIDGTPLYSFSLEYRYLPKLFETIQNRLAIYKQDISGNVSVFYFISNQTEAWGFLIKKEIGKIERLNATRLRELFENVLADEGDSMISQPHMPCRFCINCGSLLNAESRFCRNCGKAVNIT